MNRGIGLNRLFQTRLDTSLINKRKVDSEVQRLILGEIRDPREAFISTVSELSNFVATDRFLSLFKESGCKHSKCCRENAKTSHGSWSDS